MLMHSPRVDGRIFSNEVAEKVCAYPAAIILTLPLSLLLGRDFSDTSDISAPVAPCPKFASTFLCIALTPSMNINVTLLIVPSTCVHSLIAHSSHQILLSESASSWGNNRNVSPSQQLCVNRSRLKTKGSQSSALAGQELDSQNSSYL